MIFPEVSGVARRLMAVLLSLLLVVVCALPACTAADTEAKVVRVGWYDAPFNYKDQFNRRTGYAYEYQRKIAAYTGWKYEYIEGTWTELLQMLKDGRIDLMSDVSYMEDRAEYMLYSSIPMGSELYYLYVSPGNKEITIEDYNTLNGKTVGITMGTVQKGLFENWLAVRNIALNLVELDCPETESLQMMQKGELDAFVTLDAYDDPEIATPLWKIGSSDFYFAVSKNRPDLLSDLDVALNRIQDEDKYYSEKLSAKYLNDAGTYQYLTLDEQEWLAAHGPIRVGYQDHYLAFCAADPKTGELTGALKDYLEFAAGSLENATPVFEPVCFPTAAEALEALKRGEIDCMFPANLSDHDAEQAGLVMTSPLMCTEMDAVVRAGDRQSFLRSTQVRVGVNKGNPNYEMFLVEHFPTWTPVYYNDTPACLDAVASGAADCVIVSNYRFNDISRQCSRLKLTTVYTGVDMDYCLAVKEGNTQLYSVLAKMVHQVPESVVNAALTYYSSDTGAMTILDYLREHPSIAALDVICLALIVTVIILAVKLSKANGKKSGHSKRKGTAGA